MKKERKKVGVLTLAHIEEQTVACRYWKAPTRCKKTITHLAGGVQTAATMWGWLVVKTGAGTHYYCPAHHPEIFGTYNGKGVSR